MVPGPELRVRCRLPGQGPRSPPYCAHGALCVQARILLRMLPQRPPAYPVRAGQDVAEEMRGRFGDSQLDFRQHEGVSQVRVDHREERRL